MGGIKLRVASQYYRPLIYYLTLEGDETSLELLASSKDQIVMRLRFQIVNRENQRERKVFSISKYSNQCCI